MNNKTLNYYNENAQMYADNTFTVNFAEEQDRFLPLLPKNGRILDFGCGSGRDTKYFLAHGYICDASDGSEEMVKIASDNTGIPVKQMLFTELNIENVYDGIWACSSILHCSRTELPEVFIRMRNALKENGIIYTSFKYGTFEGERNGRYFTYFTEDTFKEFIGDISGLVIEEISRSQDVLKGREQEQWLNVILRKESMQ